MSEINVLLKQPDRIGVRFPYHESWVNLLKSMKESQWHASERMWSVPLTGESLDAVRKAFRSEKLSIDPAIEAHLKSAAELDLLRQELRLRNYSQKTIKAYRSCIRTFLKFILPWVPRGNHLATMDKIDARR